MNIDEIYHDLGDLGRQQCRYVLVFCLLRLNVALNELHYNFAGRQIPFACHGNVYGLAQRHHREQGAVRES